MIKISFCAIVKNEEKLLPQCLKSVRNVVDEMVVLDTGSTDKTVAIAQELGARVEHFTWNNNFSAARNYALQFVKGQWVLVLDADEVLTPEIVPQLHKAIENKNHLVVNLIREEVGAAQSPYSLVSRLFRNHPEVKFSRPYHTLIDDTVAQLRAREPGWKIVTLKPVGILHYGYQPEAIAALDKYNRARKAMEVYLAQHPQDAYVCTKLGALYVQVGEIELGKELLERGLQAKEVNAPVLFELHYHLGNVYTRLCDPYEAAIHYQNAIAQDILPQLKLGAYNNLGTLLQAVGEFPEAQKAYETAIKIAPNFAVGYYNLAMNYKELGQFHQAVTAYQQAIKINPRYAEAYQNLGVAYWKLGKVPESIGAFQEAIALHEKDNPEEAERLREGLQKMGMGNY